MTPEELNKLKSLSIYTESYIYVPIDNKEYEVPLTDLETGEKYAINVIAEEIPNQLHLCATYDCHLRFLNSCLGLRCIAGGRKDGKAVVFKITKLIKK